MNNELISRSDLKKELFDFIEPDGTMCANDVIKAIDGMSTIPLPDFKEGYKQAIRDGKTNFSRPKGEWIRPKSWEDGYKGVVCSNCGKKFDIIEWSPEMFFCYNCGTDMKEDCINFLKRNKGE